MRRALWMASGVLVWAAHFTAIYGFTGLACARGWTGAVAWVVGAATALALTACVAIIARSWTRRFDFLAAVAVGLAAFALVAVLWEGLSITMVPACVSR
ncbi:MAG TPA: hypothetical protein VEC19_16305 [Usitatibacter sp.]|nr:hypothetical protein [Usitatibacter sp.]